MKNTFSIREIFSKAYSLTKKHWEFLVSATFLYYLVYILLSKSSHGPSSLILTLGGIVISIIFTIGMYKVAFAIESGFLPKAQDFKTDIDTILSVIFVSILNAIIVGVGFVLLIIPGIIAAVRFSMAFIIVLDKKITGVEALKESWRITKGYGWKLVLFSLCIGAIMIISLIPFGLGLLVSMPFSIIAFVILYKKLNNMSEVVVELVKDENPASAQPLPEVQEQA